MISRREPSPAFFLGCLTLNHPARDCGYCGIMFGFSGSFCWVTVPGDRYTERTVRALSRHTCTATASGSVTSRICFPGLHITRPTAIPPDECKLSARSLLKTYLQHGFTLCSFQYVSCKQKRTALNFRKGPCTSSMFTKRP